MGEKSADCREKGEELSKREIRHGQLLEIARDLLIEEGLIGLTFEELARRVDVTRPTIYGHFESQAAILSGVAQRNLEVTKTLMARAAGFTGTHRERLFGMILGYEVMARFETAEFHMTEFLGMPWVRSRLPDDVASAFADMVSSYYKLVESLVVGAVAAGELVLRPGMTAGNVVFHSLSMSYGIYTSIVKERIILTLSQPTNSWLEARTTLQCYWDGIGWAREGSEASHTEVAERFMDEVFRDYWIEDEVGKFRNDLERRG